MGAHEIRSVNFGFLRSYAPLLDQLAAHAERYCFDDPNTSLIKSRQLVESLAQETAARVGVYAGSDRDLLSVTRELTDRGVLTRDLAQLFHGVRKLGNAAACRSSAESGQSELFSKRHIPFRPCGLSRVS
jgi:type I restriction enzyme R subunit